MDVRVAVAMVAIGGGLIVLGVLHWRGTWGWLRTPERWGVRGTWVLAAPVGASFVMVGLTGLLTVPETLSAALAVAAGVLLPLAVVARLLAALDVPLCRPPWERDLRADAEVRRKRGEGAGYAIDLVHGWRARPLEATFASRDLAEQQAREELAKGDADYAEVVDLGHAVTVGIVEP
jgi:hypothetical protein